MKIQDHSHEFLKKDNQWLIDQYMSYLLSKALIAGCKCSNPTSIPEVLTTGRSQTCFSSIFSTANLNVWSGLAIIGERIECSSASSIKKAENGF